MTQFEKYLLKATRVPCFDMVGDENYGDRPYGVVLDVCNNKGEFVESGTDWSYFETEKQAEEFIKNFNTLKTHTT